MKVSLIIVTILLVAALAGGGFFFLKSRQLNADIGDLQTELAGVRDTLISTEVELGDKTTALRNTETCLTETQSTLTTRESELEETRHTLVQAQEELDSTKDDLDAAERELGVTKAALNIAEKSIDEKELELDELKLKYRFANETLLGLDMGIQLSRQCYDVTLIDNPEAKDPTWAELKAFLAADKTEDHEYILYEYDCSQFSRDLHNAAEAAGIRCAEVQVNFEGERWGHALNAFLTTDYGLVYVDCTGGPDTIARVVSGKEYRAVAVPNVVIKNVRTDSWWSGLWMYYYMESSTGGHAKVSNIRIYW